MKNCLTLLTLLLLTVFCTDAQTMKNDDDLKKRIGEIEDRLALKELVDTFSTLSDRKAVREQTQLFIPNAVVETYRGGVLVTKLIGRKELEDSFGGFLKNFETVYHINGQQTVSLNGDRASGISYCMVTLIGVENGKKMKTSIGVFYEDEYVRENKRWLIAKRVSNFHWEEKREVGR
jgi:hypothetical protein